MPTDDPKLQRAAEIQAAIETNRKKEADEKRRVDEEGKKNQGQKLDRMLDNMTRYFEKADKKMDAMTARLDTFEKERDDARKRRRKDDDDDTADDELTIKHGDDDHEPFAEQPTQATKAIREPGMARPVVADSRADAERRAETLMAAAQERADTVAGQFGLRAAPPLVDYRRRLLRPLQRHSTQFAGVDLGTIRDPKVFDGIEASVFADATKAAGMPQVGVGQLRTRHRMLPSGHQEISWHGDPRVWMDVFAGASREALVLLALQSQGRNSDSFC